MNIDPTILELTGIIGACLALSGYLMVVRGRINETTHLVNVYASMFLAHYSLFKHAWAYLALSCVWFIVGIVAMWRELNKQDYDVLADEQV